VRRKSGSETRAVPKGLIPPPSRKRRLVMRRVALAVVTGLSSYTETVKARDVSGEYRSTDTWIKKGGRWQCIAAEASKVGGK
jgi:hypothetical protein